MAIFGVKFDPCLIAERFFSDTKTRLAGENLVKNPFTGDIKIFDDLSVVSMKPVYFNFAPYILFMNFVLILAFGLRWFNYVLFIISLVGVLWSKYFFYFFLKLGLKKKGYKGNTSLVSSNKILKKVVFEWDKQKLINSL